MKSHHYNLQIPNQPVFSTPNQLEQGEPSISNNQEAPSQGMKIMTKKPGIKK